MRPIKDTKELRAVQIGILDYLDTFCKEHGIRYFLVSGTLLGAVRHKGYIPWDDDIDVGVPRSDYEKLIKLFENGKNGKYVMYHFSKQPDYMYPFAKLCNDETVLKEDEGGNEFGIYIDVFPFDNMPTDESERAKFFSEYDALWKDLTHKTLVFKKRPGFTGFYHNMSVVYYKLRFMFTSSTSISKEIDRHAQKYDDVEDCEYAGLASWGTPLVAVKKECLTDCVQLEFEGKQYPVPKGYDGYLKAVYGDYMQLPPEEKRFHHNFQAWWKD